MNDESYRLDFERKLVRHATPALAALKPANLFTCRDQSVPNLRGNGPKLADPREYQENFAQALHTTRSKLEPCGVRIEVLARRTTGALIYVYRPNLVKRCIRQEDVEAYLRKEGYDPSSLSSCIERLHRRICGTDVQSQLTKRCSFPHEIGFFLGYPYKDVVGFIENRGENFLCSGCWKVYAQQRDAQACFCCYKNCTTVYESLFNEGVSLECLATVDEHFPAAEAFRAAG